MIKAQDTITLTRVNDGAKGNPTGITVSSTEPSSKYTGMLWKCTGNISGKIQNATYRWNGSSWELYVFKAANIDVNDLFAQNITAKYMTIEGDSTFSGELKAAKGTFAGEVKAKNITIESTDISTAQNAGTSTRMTVSGNSFNVLQNCDSQNPSGTSGKSWQQSVISIQDNPDQSDEKEVLIQTEDRLLSSNGTVSSGGKNNVRVNLNGVEVNAKYTPVTIKSGDKINLNADSGVFVNGKDVTDTFEPKIKRSNSGAYYKDGYTCHLHAWWVDATSVFFPLGVNFRPKSHTTCIGFCIRKDNACSYPLMCELESSGNWQVWAMTSIGTSGGGGLWTVYQPANGIDHRSEFTVCVTGSWLTNSNGG